MTTVLRQRVAGAREYMEQEFEQKKKLSGWVLERQSTTFGDANDWSNVDLDVTPAERRTWTAFTMLGFWVSDAMNAQGWEAPASIIAVGLTWREALYCQIIGNLVDCIPLVLNGVIGSKLHIPFPVAIRSSFGLYFARFAVVVRMITALFWHAIQTYTGSLAMTQCIRAIWPSYLDIPNQIPESVGITTQQMISHLIFWSIQFPILLIPPYKLKWFFMTKAVLVVVTSIGVVIAMTAQAGGTGDIFNQEATVSGTTKTWLILSSISSITGGWATMATNIGDFTRYLKKPKGVYYQVLFLPLISVMLGLAGIITLAAQWDGPAGRAGAFFVGFTWVIAQIGTNLSANVISCANDITSLFPKYVNIRRGAILATVTAGWIMVPWKIVYSAESLLAFMSGLGIFLAPIAAILGADYWFVKKQAIDVPALYRKHARYRYNVFGTNWRAVVAFIVSVCPNIPGMAVTVNPNLQGMIGNTDKIYDIFYFWGYTSAFVVYIALSHFFPATDSLVPVSITEDDQGKDDGSIGTPLDTLGFKEIL